MRKLDLKAEPLEWVNIANVPIGMKRHEMFAYKTDVFTVGDNHNIYRYDPTNNVWEYMVSLESIRLW